MKLYRTFLFVFLNISLFANESYTVNISSLEEAIIKISQQSKLPYLVDINILKGKKANPIKNVKGLEKAFSLLLKNTGLEAVILNKTIVIKKSNKEVKSINFEENKLKELKSITIIGKQKSYYEDSSLVRGKREVLDIESPYTTNVINETFIKDTQALRVEDIYSYTTGVFNSDPRADGIIIRGIEINLQNIQLDGMPGLVSRFGSPTTSYVNKVEFLKGPASVFYGNIESGGLIYIQSKKPHAKEQITFETSYSTYASDISGFGDANSFITNIDIEGIVQDNLYYRFIVQKDKIESFRNNVEYDNLYIYPSLTWEISDNSLLELSFEYGKEKGSADQGLAVLNNDISTAASINTVYQENGDFDNDKGFAFTTRFEHHLKNDSLLNLSFRSVIHEDERKLYESKSVKQTEQTLIRRFRHQYNERDWHTLDANYSFLANTKNISHDIIIGGTLNYRRTLYDRLLIGSNLAGINIYNPILEEKSTGKQNNKRETIYKSAAIYLQNKIDITDDFNLIFSGRFDKTKVDFDCIRGESKSCIDTSTDTNNFVSSVGAVYNINPLISIYASLGQSYDTYSSEKIDIKGKALDSEESEQIEMGVKFNVNEQFNTTVSAYKIDKKNVAEKISSNIYDLAGKVESKGYEIDLQWLATSNLQFKAGYSFNKSKFVSGSKQGQNLANNPKHGAFIFSKYNLPMKVFDGVLGFSSGISYKSAIYTNSDKAKAVKLPSYTKADLGIHYDKKDWGFSLNIENITDKEYFEYGDSDYRIYVGDPRKVTFNFKKTF